MALSPKLPSFLFLVTLLSTQIQARDSQFFSKVSATTNNDNAVVTVPINNEQQQQQQQRALNKQEQDPTFIPETQNGYGLYGHESTENIHATTTTTYTPYTTQPQETNNNNNNYFSNNAYEAQQQNLGETRLQENSYTTMANQNNNNNNNQYYYNNGRGGYNNGYVPNYQENNNNYDGRSGYNGVPSQRVNSYTSTLANQDNIKYNNKYSNGERQGMSDTRFMENGKYYYDVNKEQNYYPKQYEQNSRGVASRKGYNTAGGYYGSNNENANSMEGYQNNQVEEEFGETEEFEP